MNSYTTTTTTSSGQITIKATDPPKFWTSGYLETAFDKSPLCVFVYWGHLR